MTQYTSVTVSYDDGIGSEGANGPVLALEGETEVKPPYGTAYARLFTSAGVTPALTATGGNVTTVNNAVTGSFQEVITFSGSLEASFERPTVSNVEFAPAGKFLNRKGQYINKINLTVNAKNGIIKASEFCYGAVLVSYTSTYKRLSAPFQTLPISVASDTLDSEFAPCIFLALYNGTAVTYTASPPSKSEDPNSTKKGFYSTGNEQAAPPGLILELDPTFPVSLKPSGNGAVARAVFFVYPGGNPTVECTSGLVLPAASFNSIADLLQGPSVFRREPLGFSNSVSQSLRYPPAGNVGVVAGGEFRTKFGDMINPYFATPGESVNAADWQTAKTFTTAGTRVVRSNEIVVCTGGKLTVPCTGVAIANYATTRTRYAVEWGMSGNWFPPVVVFAQDQLGRYGQLNIEAPVRRGLV